MQVLWERGFIDVQNQKQYTVGGKKLPDGTLDLSKSLLHMLGECLDFKQEISALQHLGSQLGIQIDHTPKFHAELAGEGIEYAWAVSKNWYRKQPLTQKKGLQKFKDLVKKANGLDVITEQSANKCSRRARAYICTYYYLSHRQDQQQGQQLGQAHKQQLLFKEIQKLQKLFKAHRCALHFDSGFSNALFREIPKEARATAAA